MNTKTWFVVGGILIIVIALGLYAAHGTAPAADAALVTNDNAILLPDQPSTTDTVVPYVKLSQPGFVLVYTTTTTTTTGGRQVLGTSDLLSAGEHRNVRVHHHNGSKPANGSTITATIVADNGDGTYSADSDTQTLIPDDEQPTADVSEDAVVDMTQTDEEIATELTNAGYDVNEDVVESDQPVQDESAATTNESVETETDTPTSTDETDLDSSDTASSTDDIEVQPS